MSRYIHNLILEGEHQRLDFKFEISDAKKIARTFAAFANTSGGTLLIGVKDNGNITGLRSDEEEYMAESAAHIYCKPRVEYKIVTHKVNDKTILEIVIPESSSKPHKAPWKDDTWEAFVRVDDQNFVADSVLREVWKIKHRDKKLMVRYNNYEEILFELIRSNGRVTLKDFIKKTKIKRYLAIKILSQLVAIHAIDNVITEKETYYTVLEGLE
ncbi:MAG TPA: ATP-binding protein [Bacteroidales bacterium]|nr:ATP-binding protein [Bacteroidales bacterium]